LILTAAPSPVRDFSPGVPEALQAVVLHCLEKDRDRRFADVSQVAFALAPFGSRATSRSIERISRILGSSSGLDLMPASSAPALAQGAGTYGAGTQANWGQTTASRSSAVPLVAAGAVAVLLLGGLAAFFVLRAKPGVEPALAGSGQPIAADAVPSAAPAPPVAVVPLPEPVAVPPTAPAVSARPAPAVSPVAAPAAATKPPTAKPVVAPAATPPPPAPAKSKRSVEDLLSGRN
jgi:eukaryotic-like serine/threonine-protein kinase